MRGAWIANLEGRIRVGMLTSITQSGEAGGRTMVDEEWMTPWQRERRPMNEAEWLADPGLYHMLDFLQSQARNRRSLRLFACACCRRAWALLRLDAARRIVELAEAHAD